MKLLLINIQQPSESFEIKEDKVGAYLLGRRITNYALFIVSSDNELTRIEFPSADCTLIDKEVKTQVELQRLRESVKELEQELSRNQ